MRKRRLLWQLYPPYLLVLLALLIVLAWYAQSPTLAALAAIGGVATGIYGVARIAHPLEQIRAGADHFARGDLNYQLKVPASGELASLAEALNKTASELKERISTIEQQRGQQQAVLSSMAEGVLAVDQEGLILSMNTTAASLLGVTLEVAEGQKIGTVIRNAELKEFIQEVLESSHPLEDDVYIGGGDARVVQARGAALFGAPGEGAGAVIVLNDVTRYRQLENVRRDFVANVSHELKTPITSIKGFVETMLDGALEDEASARRFLRIVARQADRLHAIIDDLLSLSKIEQSGEAGDLQVSEQPILSAINSAVHNCEAKRVERNILVEVSCDRDLQAPINGPLLEQAITNLLDNAVKYTEPGKNVFVETEQIDGEIAIRVRDEGCGISSEHLPRLFERFYRVDRARSRDMGGTGLGLAIVKHIAQAPACSAVTS